MAVEIPDSAESNRSPLMGLSDLPRLQQSDFIKKRYGKFIFRIVGSQIVIFNEISTRSNRRQLTDKELQNLEKKKFTGTLSRKSQAKIKKTMAAWADTIEEFNLHSRINKTHNFRKLVLVTLTLSKRQKHDDNYIKRHMLGYFLTQLIRIKKDLKFLWKAESQKNGNIHFHIIIDHYIEKEKIQKIWNEIQIAHGYHDNEKFTKNYQGMPSTRIEGLKNKNNATAYVAKYISKNDGERELKGRLWGCSNELKQLKNVEYIITKEELLYLVKEMIANNSKFMVDDYFMTVYKAGKIKELKDSLRENISARAAYEHNLKLLFNIPDNIEAEIDSQFDESDPYFYDDDEPPERDEPPPTRH